MSKDELLKPRYKVIADYPKSVYEVGTIINAGTTSEDCIYCDREGPRMRHYPHLFKKLEWWEERKLEEMPVYIRNNDVFYKVDKWSGSFQNVCWLGCYVNGERKYIASEELHPATREEYEQYINQQTSTNGKE